MLGAEHLSLLCLSHPCEIGAVSASSSIAPQRTGWKLNCSQAEAAVDPTTYFQEKVFLSRGAKCSIYYLHYASFHLQLQTAIIPHCSGGRSNLPRVTYHAQTLQMSKHNPTKSKSG